MPVVTVDQRRLSGEIVEDRGAIGIQGRRLFRVRFPMAPYEPMMMELPEDEMEAVPAEEAPPSIGKEKAIEYLIQGGLISILGANTSGGRNQPRAWLCLDQVGPKLQHPVIAVYRNRRICDTIQRKIAESRYEL